MNLQGRLHFRPKRGDGCLDETFTIVDGKRVSNTVKSGRRLLTRKVKSVGNLNGMNPSINEMFGFFEKGAGKHCKGTIGR